MNKETLLLQSRNGTILSTTLDKETINGQKINSTGITQDLKATSKLDYLSQAFTSMWLMQI